MFKAISLNIKDSPVGPKQQGPTSGSQTTGRPAFNAASLLLLSCRCRTKLERFEFQLKNKTCRIRFVAFGCAAALLQTSQALLKFSPTVCWANRACVLKNEQWQTDLGCAMMTDFHSLLRMMRSHLSSGFRLCMNQFNPFILKQISIYIHDDNLGSP